MKQGKQEKLKMGLYKLSPLNITVCKRTLQDTEWAAKINLSEVGTQDIAEFFGTLENYST